jgi:hypothetical protein
MTPTLPGSPESRRLRLRSQLAAHIRWTLAETADGRIDVAAATRHLAWLRELHAHHLAALERPIAQRPFEVDPGGP